jgi:hypothetical protein
MTGGIGWAPSIRETRTSSHLLTRLRPEVTLEINNKFSQHKYQWASSTTTIPPIVYPAVLIRFPDMLHVSHDVDVALELPLSPPLHNLSLPVFSPSKKN